ncbi:hypothetical protein [Micropruina sonneratiae]|uniref:hypothetical protein n=1 Tax=Micropruina sonneratiae TaxID=2986940 RepID=UPI00222634E7|nr:hypothetical protein [Micropruina sp. KQZ13P-5]MCW3159475.1 hypothetical protein [Micropruina sp. KQZ13P-5]
MIRTLNWISNSVLHLFRVEPKDEAASAYTIDQVATIVEQSEREGTLVDASGTLSAVFEFTEKSVSDVEVPLDALITVSADVTPRQLQESVAVHGFSRYPMRAADGALTGYLHLKDVLDLTEPAELDQPVPDNRIRALPAVARTAELEDALPEVRTGGAHIARVTGPDGATTGVLFLEDVVEELIGEVHDATAG